MSDNKAANKNGGNGSKFGSAFAGLSKREQVLIYLCAVIIVGAVLIFMVMIPGLTKLSNLTDSVSELEDERLLRQNTIAQTDAYKKMYAEAQIVYDLAREHYYITMEPETLDGTITGLLVQSGFEPETLSMTTLTIDAVPPFAPGPLRESALTDQEEDVSGEEEAGAASFVYTVTASAEGSYKNLYDLLDLVSDIRGLEIASFAYTKGEQPTINTLAGAGAAVGSALSGNSSLVKVKDTVTIIFKVYVFVDGLSASDGEAGTPTEPAGSAAQEEADAPETNGEDSAT